MAKTVNLSIDQGATFSKTLYFKDSAGTPVDMTGYTFRGQLRIEYDDVLPQAAFTCEVIDGPAGVVSVTLSDTETAALEPGVLLYDIEMVRPNSTVMRLLQGKATVSPEVTK